MRRIVLSITALCALCASTGCAAIVSGTDGDVTIRSQPPGAEVSINGLPRGTTPLTLRLSRAESHVMTVSKKGYETESREVEHTFNGWVLGNLVFGGILGIIIDFASGAFRWISPSDYDFTLKAKP